MHGDAKKHTEIANEKEIVDKATVISMGKDKYADLTEDGMQKTLDSSGDNAKVYPDGENLLVQFIESNRYYKVDKDGIVTGPIEVIVDISPGDITKGINGEDLDGEDKPYEIWCIEDLVAFSQNVTKGNNYVNKSIKLCRTLDFKSILSYTDFTTTKYDEYLGGNGESELMTQLSTNGKGFVPIGGSVHNFCGTFDGQGFEIKNIYENIDGNAGLFVFLENATIQNLSITGEIIGTSQSGGIVSGYYMNNGSTIINCKNYANITGITMVGGIGGWIKNSKIINCQNYGEITVTSTAIAYGGAGGILGYANNVVNVEGCYNEGEIKGQYICGGIVGAGVDIDIKNCENKAKVHSTGSYSNGGILGWHRGGTINIKNCFNEGIIGEKSSGSSGGIIGSYTGVDLNTDRLLNINNCYNKGDIVSEGYCGGILGNQGLISLTIKLNIENSYSVGNVLGKYSGGIVGKLTASDSRTTAIQSIKNTYYLETTADKAIYSGQCTEEESIESLNMEYMKSEEFLNKLNIDNNEWKKGDDGYPSF